MIRSRILGSIMVRFADVGGQQRRGLRALWEFVTHILSLNPSKMHGLAIGSKLRRSAASERIATGARELPQGGIEGSN